MRTHDQQTSVLSNILHTLKVLRAHDPSQIPSSIFHLPSSKTLNAKPYVPMIPPRFPLPLEGVLKYLFLYLSISLTHTLALKVALNGSTYH